MPRVRPVMSSTLRRLVAVTAAVVMVATVSTTGALAEPFERQPDDPIAVARDQRRALQERIAAQEAAIARLERAQVRVSGALEETTDALGVINADLGALRARIAVAVADLAAAEAEHAGLVGDLESLDWTLGLLAAQADELEADLDERRGQLSARLAKAYVVGHTSFWEQVLAGDSIFDAAVEQQSFLALGAQDAQLAASIEADQALLAEQRLGISHARYETEALRERVAERAVEIELQRSKLERDEAELAVLEAETERLLAEQQAHYEELLANGETAAQLLERHEAADAALETRIGTLLEEERHAGRLPSKFNGKLRWPLIGRITQEFGCTGFEWEPPFGDCAHFHDGIDVVGGYQAPIVAAGDGVILFVGRAPGAADPRDASWSVVIAHSERLITTYGHMVPRAPHGIRVGMKVRAGQRIGWMGNTGHSTGAHLHWSVIFDSLPRNPRYFL